MLLVIIGFLVSTVCTDQVVDEPEKYGGYPFSSLSLYILVTEIYKLFNLIYFSVF